MFECIFSVFPIDCFVPVAPDSFMSDSMQKPDAEPVADGKGPAAQASGRNIPLSVPRRIICDLMAISKGIPTVPVQRQMNITGVVVARRRLPQTPDLPGWCAIFTKAYALTTLQFPELRRAYLPFPRPHLYEHPHSSASIAVEREYEGEHALFWGQLRCPEQRSLWDLQAHLRHYKDEPIGDIVEFRRQLRNGGLPWLVRRLIWWFGLNFSGRKRAGYLGTFAVSVYSGLGAESLHPISPLTTLLNYGPIGKDGAVSVRIVYDHRVLDGPCVARSLACLEDVLNSEIVAELGQEVQARAA